MKVKNNSTHTFKDDLDKNTAWAQGFINNFQNKQIYDFQKLMNISLSKNEVTAIVLICFNPSNAGKSCHNINCSIDHQTFKRQFHDAFKQTRLDIESWMAQFQTETGQGSRKVVGSLPWVG